MKFQITIDTECRDNGGISPLGESPFAKTIVGFLNGTVSAADVLSNYEDSKIWELLVEFGRILFCSVAYSVSVPTPLPEVSLLPLEKYPVAIASLRIQMSLLNSTMQLLREQIEEVENEADKSVSFDATLRNEAQRSVRRYELLKQNSQYAALKKQMKTSSELKTGYEIELDRLRGEFSAARSLVQQKMLSSIASTSPYFGDDDFEDFLNLQVQKRLQQEIETQSLNN